MSNQILVINSGSTSLKYKLFLEDNLEILQENDFQNIENHLEALKTALREIGDLSRIKVIGHRVVHGGRDFFNPIVVDQGILKRLEEYNYLAPLHNPYNLAGIKACQEYLPNIPNVAVFDTGFFKYLPEKAKIYAIPYEFYEKFGIQRFGFHGLSHQFVAEEAAKELRKPLARLKLITCHLGGGCSITAIDKGKPVDMSMGFTPLEGLVMMTRCGDIDAGVVLKLFGLDSNISNKSRIQKINDLLNFESGIKGVSGHDDYLELLKAVTFGEEKAKLAFDLFIYRIKKYIGAYYAILNGCDALIFTGAIGAGKPITRKKICQDMKILDGIKILAIETNEEIQIARNVKKFMEGK